MFGPDNGGDAGSDEEKFAEKSGNDLKKRERGGILIDSDVVYPEYDVRKVPESGSSGAPFFRFLRIQSELNEEQS